MALIRLANHTNRMTQLRIALLAGIFAVAPFWAQHGFGMCIFHRMTGLECPICGMTRAFYAISHGQFAQAIHFNALSLALYFFLAGVLLRDVLQLLTGMRIPIPTLLTRQEPLIYLVLSFFVATAYFIARNVGALP